MKRRRLEEGEAATDLLKGEMSWERKKEESKTLPRPLAQTEAWPAAAFPEEDARRGLGIPRTRVVLGLPSQKSLGTTQTGWVAVPRLRKKKIQSADRDLQPFPPSWSLRPWEMNEL